MRRPLRLRGRSKYGAVPTVVDNIRFASKREATRYRELRLLEQAGEIAMLKCHPRFELLVNGQDCGDYVGDFWYFDRRSGRAITEDTKGVATPVYRLKRKLVKAIHGVDIVEV
jgi:uncharacterized protein DUF1064